MKLSLEEVVNGAVGPFDDYSEGYGHGNASGQGYISVLKLQTGIVKADMDEVLDGIVSYDRAETDGAYVGQINMVTASSFNGLNGAVWGYHLAKEESIANGTIKPLFMKKRSDGKEIPVYSVNPLLTAGERLFGTAAERRFPLLPGAHVNCAVKSKTTVGPSQVWCAIALAIAEDRTKDSNLFIEDANDDLPTSDEESSVRYLSNLLEKIAVSIIRCGDDSRVKYKEIFVGFKHQMVPEGHVGCSLTCAPYIVMAKNAIPKAGPASMLGMTITEWEKAVGLR